MKRSQWAVKTRKKEKKVCGLWSVPDDVLADCLAHVSRLDLVALAMVSKIHRSVAVSEEIRALRYRTGSADPYLYVFMHMYPEPNPRWLVLHPVQRRLKRVNLDLYSVPIEGSCFVMTDWGIYSMGGLVDGIPTSKVTYFDCIDHTLYGVAPMKMARSGASASFIDEKIYVFGGCWDVADSSNWVEVFDMETGTWELLSVFTPKMPLKIQRSVVIDEKRVFAVDEDGEVFVFSTSECIFKATGKTESNPENINDLLFFDKTLVCRSIGGRILFLLDSDWKEVKGLEELQQQHSGFNIIKLCFFSVESIGIFWESRPQGPDQILELWFAEISLTRRLEGEERVVRGKIEWSGAVLSDSSYTGLNLLYARSLYI